jgi:hypothetical protein
MSRGLRLLERLPRIAIRSCRQWLTGTWTQSLVPQINVQIMQAPVEAPKLTHEGPKEGEKVQ